MSPHFFANDLYFECENSFVCVAAGEKILHVQYISVI